MEYKNSNADKYNEIIEQLPKSRSLSCEDSVHKSTHRFAACDTYEMNFNVLKGITEQQASIALVFIEQHPNFVVIKHEIDSWGIDNLISKMPPLKDERSMPSDPKDDHA